MSGARLVPGSGQANVATGVPLLDHLLVELALAARFDLSLEIEPDAPVAEVDAAGAAIGAALAPLLASRAHGTGPMVADEALAMASSRRPDGLSSSPTPTSAAQGGSEPISRPASSPRSRTPPG